MKKSLKNKKTIAIFEGFTALYLRIMELLMVAFLKLLKKNSRSNYFHCPWDHIKNKRSLFVMLT